MPTSAKRRFSATVLSGHKGNAIEVPFDPASEWVLTPTSLRRGRKGHRVIGTLDGERFESEIVARAKKHWLLINAPEGETVTVVIEPAPP